MHTVPAQAGKVFMITGGTAGLGTESILALSRQDPAHIYFTGRNEASATKLIERVKREHTFDRITFLKADASSLQSMDELASKFLAANTGRLDVLMCNAGIMATDPAVSVDGYEIQMATNHLGHALLIRRLLPLLQRTAETYGDARIVNLTSSAHNLHPKEGIDFRSLDTTQAKLGTVIPGPAWARYGQSRLANMLYPDELTARYPRVRSIAVHPGIIETGLITEKLSLGRKIGLRINNFSFKKTYAEEGARNQIWAATAPEARGGVYYVPVGKQGKREKMGNDRKLATELWDWTQQALDKYDARL